MASSCSIHKINFEGSDRCDLIFQRLWSRSSACVFFVFPELDMLFVSEEGFVVAQWSRQVQEGSSVSSQDYSLVKSHPAAL